jgi:hypothetical protein
MNGVHDNYAPSATNGQNVQPYAPSAGPKNPLVDKYFHQIESNWQERAADANVMGKVPPPPSLTRSLEIRKNLEEGLIQRELGKVREEFLIEARKLEAKRMIALEAQYEEKYRNLLEEKDAEINRAYRIINIEDAILSKADEKHPGLLVEICQDANITIDDLKNLTKLDKSID